MTRGELRTLVAGWLDDLNYGYFTEPMLNSWLNNAQFTVQKRLLKAGQLDYMKPVQTTTVSGQSDYVLPQDFWKLHRLEIVTSGSGSSEKRHRLNPITPNEQDFVSTGAGTPKEYFIKRNRLVLYPVPDSALTLRLFYSYRVTDMLLDTDEPDVPPQYHELIALEAACDGFMRDEKVPTLLLEKKSQFEVEFDQSAQERNEDEPRYIAYTGADE